MNFVWATSLALAVWLLVVSTEATADTRLLDSSYEDWTGMVKEMNLPDGSVLFEYVARTFSGNTQGATLAISFVPRFDCAPMVAIRLPKEAQGISDTSTVSVGVGGEELTYNSFVDEDGEFAIHSLASNQADLQALREMIDVSARARVKVLSMPAEGASTSTREVSLTGTGGSAMFSLLGSRLATLSVEKNCVTHKPLEYTPR